jgi:probable F420-dependent oxidoreductase
VNVDAMVTCELSEAADKARQAEQRGFDRMLYAEVAHDPFLPLTHAAAATRHISLGTGIAVAFARSPMTVAVTSMDLQRQSGGRFVLGLGSQIKPHITRRFSMPWSQPAARMAEYVSALRAIWASWQQGTPLSFEGDFYTHNLMTPMFSHGPSEVPDPQIYLAGVGPEMTKVAGRVADGYLAHGFTTPSYLRSVTIPYLQAGLEQAGRTRSQLEISIPLFTAMGRDQQDLDVQTARIRSSIAFYASTPAYRPVLEHHGWADVGIELTRLSKLNEWSAMSALIDDDMVEAFAIVGPPESFVAAVERKFGGLVDRVQLGSPEALSAAEVSSLVNDLREIPGGHRP